MRTIIALFVLVLGISLSATAQCGSTAMLSGCVGACGTTYTQTYTIQASDIPAGQDVAVFCLAATSNSLCPTHHAAATLVRDGSATQSGNLDAGAVLAMKGRVGSVFTVTVTAVEYNQSVDCIWLGNTNFSFSK